MIRVFSVLWIVLAARSASPAGGRAPERPPAPRGRGPWDGDIVLFESRDGLRFQEKTTLVERAGVATLLADRKHEGRLLALFQWFPEGRPEAFDRIAAKVSKDGGATWTDPEPITVAGLPDDHVRPFDPTLVELEDGRYRLYFTSRVGGAKDRPPFARGGEPRIHSAVSLAPGDAARYRFEPGVRFGVDGQEVIDCAVAQLKGEWHLFSPVQRSRGRAYHAVSRDGLKFERLANLEVESDGNWLGCAIPLGDGKTEGDGLRFYGSGLVASSKDGRSWRLEHEVRWQNAADPGVARLADGRYLLVGTSMRSVEAPGQRRSSTRCLVR
jgi:hypothetical protein